MAFVRLMAFELVAFADFTDLVFHVLLLRMIGWHPSNTATQERALATRDI